MITVSSVTERSIRATAEFNEDGSKVTLKNTIVTTTTKIRNDEIGSIESITQETTEYTYEHDVIKDSDGNTVLSVQTDFSYNTSTTSVSYEETSKDHQDLIQKGSQYNQNVEKRRRNLVPSDGSSLQDMWEYTRDSENTINRIHE
jgi:hypothetical protein